MNRLRNWYRLQVGRPTIEEEMDMHASFEVQAARGERMISAEMDEAAIPHDWDGHMPGDCPDCGAV